MLKRHSVYGSQTGRKLAHWLVTGSACGCFAIGCLALLLTVTSTCAAQEPGRVVSPRQKVDAGKGSGKKVAQKTSGEAVPLNENGTVLLDRAGGRLLVKSEVVLRQGALEMLACRKKTKEHESILSIDAEAFVIHSGLLALKATPGGPAEYEPAYKPPRGQKIAIFLNWTDKGGQSRREPAQSWVRESVNRFWLVKLEKLPAGVVLPENSELKYDSKQRELLWYGPMTEQQKKEFLGLSDEAEYRKAIEYFFERSQLRGLKSDWVFVGSGFYEDEATGQKQYLAEEGQVICVSNFQTAMIDVAAQSSDQADALLYEAWTDRIPAKGTQVMLELVPVFEKPTEN